MPLLFPMYFIRNVFNFILRLIAYIPVLWRDRDWDHNFLYDLLDFKLSRMEDSAIRRSKMWKERTSHSGGIIRQIRYARLLIKRISSEEYDDKALAKHTDKWGELKMDFLPTEDERFQVLDSYRVLAREQGKEEEENVEIMAIYKAGYAAKDKDLDRLYAHLRKHLEGWWT